MIIRSPDRLRSLTLNQACLPDTPPLTTSESAAGPLSQSRNTKFEETEHVSSDYVWWCAARHGDALRANDPQIYSKLSSLLGVMSGLGLPKFVVEILQSSHEKCTGKALTDFRRVLNLDVIKKVENMRRSSASGSRRDFALQIGEVMAVIYKQFYDAVSNMPDQEVQKSMTHLCQAAMWKQSRPAIEKLHSASAEFRCPSLLPSGTNLRSAVHKPRPNMEFSALDCDVTSGHFESSAKYCDNKVIAKPIPIFQPGGLDATERSNPAPERNIEIQFTLNSLKDNGPAGVKSLYPVESGMSVIQEPMIDTGDYGEKAKAKNVHGGWKGLRRVSRRIQKIFIGGNGSHTFNAADKGTVCKTKQA